MNSYYEKQLFETIKKSWKIDRIVNSIDANKNRFEELFRIQRELENFRNEIFGMNERMIINIYS